MLSSSFSPRADNPVKQNERKKGSPSTAQLSSFLATSVKVVLRVDLTKGAQRLQTISWSGGEGPLEPTVTAFRPPEAPTTMRLPCAHRGTQELAVHDVEDATCPREFPIPDPADVRWSGEFMIASP